MTESQLQPRLVKLPALRCYSSKGVVTVLPDRMRYIDAGAAAEFLELVEEGLVVTDLYRSVETSANIYGSRPGAARPGTSGHNWGLSIDADVNLSMERLGRESKISLDGMLRSYGFYCHRRDGKRGHEDWHYNYLPTLHGPPQGKFSSDELAREILRLHPHLTEPFAPADEQRMLTIAGYECGAIDGIVGPKTRAARNAFLSRHRIGENEDLHYRRALWATAQRGMVE